jgi:subtilisin family serine protease
MIRPCTTRSLLRANAGQVFVAAAGNGGASTALATIPTIFPSYPASYDLDNIVSVAASE